MLWLVICRLVVVFHLRSDGASEKTGQTHLSSFNVSTSGIGSLFAYITEPANHSSLRRNERADVFLCCLGKKCVYRKFLAFTILVKY
jgi:hypothetical protein